MLNREYLLLSAAGLLAFALGLHVLLRIVVGQSDPVLDAVLSSTAAAFLLLLGVKQAN